MDRTTPTRTDLPPRGVLVIFAFVFTPGFAIAVFALQESWRQWRMTEATAVVIEVRAVKDTKPHAKRVRPWIKEWLIEFRAGEETRRQAVPRERYENAREVDQSDIGHSMAVWVHPDEYEARTEPPEPFQWLLGAAVAAFLGLMGATSIYTLIRHRRDLTEMAKRNS